MPSPIRLEADVWDSWKFASLANDLGVEHECAVGRMAKMWSYASDRFLYALPEGAIRAYLKHPNAVDFLVAADLGERLDDGTVRLKGSERFDALWEKRERYRKAAQKGGQARAEGAKDESGRFVTVNTENQPIRQPMTSKDSSGSPPCDHGKTSPSGSGSGSGSDSKNPESQTKSCAADAAPHKSRARGTQSDAVKGDHVRCVEHWDRRYRERYSAKPTWNGKTGSLLAGLLRSHEADEVIRRMDVLFDGGGPAFLHSTALDLPSFAQHFDKLAARPPPRRGGSEDLLEWQLQRVREAEEAERRGGGS